MERHFNKIFGLACLLIFVIVCLRAFFVPFSHDEAATFFFYVQSDNYLPYSAHIYTNNHVLNSSLTNLCYHIAGAHRFVLRIPNILSFLIFCFGIFRQFKYFKSIYPKLIVITFFLLTFGFLDFFELCRGYGLSIGFMMLGTSYLVDYFDKSSFKHLVLFSVCWQLAVAANLILVVVMLVLLAYVYIYQLRHKLLFKAKNVLLQIINLALLAFWVKFALFYKEHGALDYGVGDNYWLVTFKTLIFILFNSYEIWLQVSVIVIFVLMMIVIAYNTFKNSFSFKDLFTPQLFYPCALILFILAFYLQKKILDVNYPEDRTGMFFYLFFVMSLAFTIDYAPNILRKVFVLLFLAPSLIYFAVSFNLSDFSTWFYHTMPKSIYQTLVKEQEKEHEFVTIGGHRVREMNYAFANYRGNSVLNCMDNSEEMQMNCDYYFAQKTEQPYYQFFYNEIAEDKPWNRVLLKRKEKIGHLIIYSSSNPMTVSGTNEFYDFKRLPDTAFKSHNPLEVDADIHFEKVPAPFHALFVMSMQNAKGETVYYKRSMLNWLADDLSGQVKRIKLTTGNLPDSVKSFTVHIWNIDKKEIKITVNRLQLYQLTGKGVDFIIPANYYPLIERATQKTLL